MTKKTQKINLRIVKTAVALATGKKDVAKTILIDNEGNYNIHHHYFLTGGDCGRIEYNLQCKGFVGRVRPSAYGKIWIKPAQRRI